MKIALGSDHGGYALKCDIIQLLEKLGHEYKDFGCYSTESCDYPDFGEAVTIRPGETPVFWACGVTPQSIVMNSKPDFCITHAPGHMLITDVKNADLKF